MLKSLYTFSNVANKNPCQEGVIIPTSKIRKLRHSHVKQMKSHLSLSS